MQENRILWVLVILFALQACSSGSEPAVEVNAVVAAAGNAGTTTPAPTAPTTPAPEPAPAPTPAPAPEPTPEPPVVPAPPTPEPEPQPEIKPPYSANLSLSYTGSPIDLGGLNARYARNVSYGPFERNRFDIFLPESGTPTALVIYMHGGAFIAGDKELAYLSNRAAQIREFLQANIAFATINYRYIEPNDQLGVIRSMGDARLALQYMRYNAGALNINVEDVAMYGYSAGAGTSLWLNFHDDMADPTNADPIRRQSTRLVTAGGIEGQATYDLVKWGTVVLSEFGFSIEQIAAELGMTQRLRAFNGVNDLADMYTTEGSNYRANVDMLELMSLDDPMFYFTNTREPPGYPTNETELVHHGLHATALQNQADAIGLASIVHSPPVGIFNASGESISAFLIRKLRE